MTTPFGPQLIGETEKTLQALLVRFLRDNDLTEPQWVTLRLAAQLDEVDATGLAAAVADRAHFPDAAALVGALTDRGLLDRGRLTAAGRDVIETTLARSGRETAPIWQDLPPEDVAAATSVLNEVLVRARRVLSATST
jgi:hypothetical protein